MTVALISAGAHLERHRRTTVILLSMAYVPLAVALDRLGATEKVEGYVVFYLTLVLAWGIGAWLRSTRAAEAERRRHIAEATRAAERTRIARELHDSVTQTLFSLTLAAESAAVLGSQPDSPESAEGLAEQLDRIRALARLGLDELRELVDTLRPADLGRDGLANALRARVDLLRAVHGIPIELRVDVARRVDAELGREVLKIANEALANALRHAGAGKVSAELAVSATRARLVVADDGTGFDLPGTLRTSRRLGLTSMRDRAEALGGTLAIDTAPGAGTTVTLEVPLP
jgi:signal transduction histidine kinase